MTPKKPFSSAEIRSAFLDYFAAQGHTVVASSSLVPGNDPTLLFTNAGMVQFKDVFLGNDPRPYVRAASSQRCVRAGGKHNDLENVGYTARHHTFFEMLGNFSFGDYFKRDAIRFAWNFLIGTLGIDPNRLWVTVYQDDDEAADIWQKEIGVPASRFTRLGEKSNFWSMGDTGPCGPCTEIFFDHGAHIPGGPPGSPDEDGDRYVEIWNLVFMQFDRSADGSMVPLPKPSVDTGMGLERICAVMQGVHSNYDIDLFAHLVKSAAKLLNTAQLDSPSLRVIADHIRACSFLVADGVTPSNEGRGYVLRRIMRRAMRHGHKFGASPTFFASLLPALTEVMGKAYPELVQKQAFIRDVLLKEGEQFARTLATGMALLDGDNGMGHLVMARAADIAVEKARTCGIGWVGSRLSNHAGPASLYARMPMAHDMIGLYLAVGALVAWLQPTSGAALWYPPVAIGMAYLLRYGVREWPWIVLCDSLVSFFQYDDGMVTALLIGANTTLDASTGIVAWHAYALTDMKQVNGQWVVTLYNPWGKDGNAAPKDGKDDGFLTVSWATVATYFKSIRVA